MSQRLAILRLVVLLVVLAGVAVLVASFGVDAMSAWLKSAAESQWGPLAFVIAYAVLVVFMLPGSLGTIAAAAVFGVLGGFGVAMAGATVGACGAFGIARTVGREGAVAIAGSRADAVDRFLAERGLLAIVVLRLLPIVPFNALNYAAGLSSVRFRTYVLGTVVGMAPGTFVVCNVAGRVGNPMSPGFIAAIVTAVVMTLASIVAAGRFRTAVTTG